MCGTLASLNPIQSPLGIFLIRASQDLRYQFRHVESHSPNEAITPYGFDFPQRASEIAPISCSPIFLTIYLRAFMIL